MSRRSHDGLCFLENLGWALCAIGASVGLHFILASLPNQPDLNQTKPGFADPSKIEIVTKRTNPNERAETFLRYNGIPYPLRVNEYGRPVVNSPEDR